MVRFGEDVPEHCGPGSLPKRFGGGPHRFHFAVATAQMLECAHGEQAAAIPKRPEGDCGTAKPVDGQNVASVRRG
jgi:hypothetical protein